MANKPVLNFQGKEAQPVDLIISNVITACKKVIVKRPPLNFWPFLMLLPALGLYLFFFFYPALFSVFLSFNDWNIFNNQIVAEGWQNYRELLADRVFQTSIINTFIYVLGTSLPLVILPLLLAVTMENCGKLRGLFRFLIYLPAVVSMSVAGLMWKFLMDPNLGVFNHFLQTIGIAGPNWLNDTKWALLSIIIVGVWRGLGTNSILYIAGLKNIPRECYEAAKVDGAGHLNAFLYITFPLIMPVTLFVLVVTIIACFQVFTTVQVMTMGGPNNATNMLVFQTWQEGFQFFDMGRACAISTILFVLLLGLSILLIRMMETRVHYQ
jgi:multiple sugar transport system permease protein